MKEYQTIIIGAGPAGLIAGREKSAHKNQACS